MTTIVLANSFLVECQVADGDFMPWLELEPPPPEESCIARAVARVWQNETAAEIHAHKWQARFPHKVFRVRALTADEIDRIQPYEP